METSRTNENGTHFPRTQRVELIGFPESIGGDLSELISKISQQDCLKFSSEKTAEDLFPSESFVSCIWFDPQKGVQPPCRSGLAIAITRNASASIQAELIRSGFDASLDLVQNSLQETAQIICAYAEKGAALDTDAPNVARHSVDHAYHPTVEYSNIGLEYLAISVEFLNIGIYALDYRQNETVAIWNKEMERLFRISSEDATGKRLDEFLTDPHIQKVFRESNSPRTRNRVIFPSKGASRSNFIADVSKTQLSDLEGQPCILLGIIKDITNRIHSENRLISAFNELEASKEKLEQSNLEIRKGIEKAKRLAVLAQSSNKAKSYFLSNISHELRTPLNSIVSLSYALLDGTFGKLNEQQAENLEIVSDSSKHLQSLINDILDLSKIELGKLNLKLAPTVIKDIAISSIRMVEQQALAKDVRCILEYNTTREHLTVDAKRLRQILLNLLVNGIKFTKPQTEVRLIVEDSEILDAIRFKVIDRGIGIAKSDYSRIFSPFTQLDDSLARQYEGTGLGLAIASKFVELHGGGVSVCSKPEEGSTFSITLPDSTTTAGNSKPSKTSLTEVALKALHMQNLVLIVDENEQSNDRLKTFFDRAGPCTPIFTLPNEISAYHDKIAPAAVFVDISLISVYGTDWITHSQKLSAWENTRWVLMSSLDLPENSDLASQFHFSRYLTKPLSTEQISEILLLPSPLVQNFQS